tara:strand:+ start:438 stop:713 length:276 start_codon:yes stop_codon:yes gene_type:complete
MTHEHKVVRIRIRAGDGAFKAEIDKQKAAGWSPHHVERAGKHHVAYLRRPVAAAPVVRPEPAPRAPAPAPKAEKPKAEKPKLKKKAKKKED